MGSFPLGQGPYDSLWCMPETWVFNFQGKKKYFHAQWGFSELFYVIHSSSKDRPSLVKNGLR